MAAQLLSNKAQKLQATEDLPTKPTRPPPPSPSKPKKDYKLVWADEFDYEGLPHPKRWGYQVEANNWVHDRNHNERQWYMASRRENSYVSGGTLKITARREDWIGNPYTSARIRTRGKGDWVYGKLLVRAKLPAGKPGMWPAIWMMPTDQKFGSWPNSGEIDVMENVGWAPGVIHNSVHTGAFNHRLGSHKHAEVVVSDAHEAFHVYGVEWDEDSIRYSIDGQRTFEFANTKSGDPREWPFSQRFHLILNVAVGGNWGAARGLDDTCLPTCMEVDYVRFYQRGADATDAPPPPPSLLPPVELAGGQFVAPRSPPKGAAPPAAPSPTRPPAPARRPPAPPPGEVAVPMQLASPPTQPVAPPLPPPSF